MSFGPERRFASITAALFFTTTIAACGSAAESSTAGEPPDVDVTHSSPAPGTNADAPSCAPAIALTTPAGAPMPPFECPSGWTARDRQTALPMSGRFTTAREIVDAYCARVDTASDAPAIVDIDFTKNDVVAIASDGDVGLFRRAGELWIRHVARACDEPPSYRTVLFLVPKGEDLHEQYCAVSCP